jgi:ElaB/YqjD/DUF883 family membrane-anchored ribosome-binding protein
MRTNESVRELSTDKLVKDFKVVVADAEELLKATASVIGDKASVARERIEQSLRDAKKQLAVAEAVVIDKTKKAAESTDQFVHEHPWKAVGVAAGIGLAIGLLIGRR